MSTCLWCNSKTHSFVDSNRDQSIFMLTFLFYFSILFFAIIIIIIIIIPIGFSFLFFFSSSLSHTFYELIISNNTIVSVKHL